MVGGFSTGIIFRGDISSRGGGGEFSKKNFTVGEFAKIPIQKLFLFVLLSLCRLNFTCGDNITCYLHYITCYLDYRLNYMWRSI